MSKKMKKITITDSCIACGFCVLSSEFIEENSDGTAKVKEPGLISDEEYIKFQEVEKECPANAIIVTDDSISSNNEVDATIELKSMMNEKIKNYKIPRPKRDEYTFHDKDYKAPPLLSIGKSNSSYKSRDKASKEGFYTFKSTMFSQRQALIQALCIEYKTKQLKKYAYYEKNEGNYYYDNNEKISHLLKEAVLLGQNIYNNKMNIPDDFFNFDVGPDSGFDGNTYCWIFRHLEELDWTQKMKNEDYFNSYIEVEEYGDTYEYSLYKVEKKFRESIVLYLTFSDRIANEIDILYKKYNEVFIKLLNEKLELLQSELKRCSIINKSPEDNKNNFISDIKNLIVEFKNQDLKEEIVFRSTDCSYDSSFRFPEYDKCKNGASNRMTRFYNECSNYLSINYSDNISNDLSQHYQKQIQRIINSFKTNLQEIYDKYSMNYPKETLYVSGDGYRLNVSLDSFDDVNNSSIGWGIRDFIDKKILRYGGALNTSNYLRYSDLTYEITESAEWKQGLFGEKRIPIYAYLPDFRKMDSRFSDAIDFCCDYTFNSEFMKAFFNNIKSSLESEMNEKVLSKL